MSLTLQLQHSVTSQADPTERAMRIAVMFGLSLDDRQRHTIVPPIELDLIPGQVVFITGVSGGGKSTLLRLIDEAVTRHPGKGPGVIWSDRLPPLSEQALVDALAVPEAEPDEHSPAPLDMVCRWLSLAGLNDAAVMLRRPSALSVGQRHRLRMAQAIAVAERRAEHKATPWTVLLADEFGSTLDRTTATAMARSIRKWLTKTKICLVVATAHDDLLEPLSPDVLVEVSPGGRCDVHRR